MKALAPPQGDCFRLVYILPDLSTQSRVHAWNTVPTAHWTSVPSSSQPTTSTPPVPPCPTEPKTKLKTGPRQPGSVFLCLVGVGDGGNLKETAYSIKMKNCASRNVMNRVNGRKCLQVIYLVRGYKGYIKNFYNLTK